ncbi:MAG TPA: methylenetetrahydrofolate reductase C-terminal domain-containing protein [Planctomycetota bacterium]|nr:methylenetetrahydrofolate reductase C-terminal domain-containing protein [Planctomycetota bacterium]
MLVTEEKPIKEILGALEADKKLFVVGCAGCPEGWETGGPQKVAELADKLRAGGKEVVGTTMIDFLCNKALVGLRLGRCIEALKAADAVLVVSCGIGVQATAAMVDKPCHPALNTISSAGFQGLWPSSERCQQCGECVLSLTGGICPITTCAKSLLNGSCGGSHEGTCEVEKNRPCGWFLIYERLKALGKLDNYKKLQPVRNFGKMDVPLKHRSTIRWALEAKEF